jgi:hypothetical protein
LDSVAGVKTPLMTFSTSEDIVMFHDQARIDDGFQSTVYLYRF